MKKIFVTLALLAGCLALSLLLFRGISDDAWPGQAQTPYIDAMGGAAVQLMEGPVTQDPRYTACLIDKAGVGVDTEWALDTVEIYWGIAGIEDCTNPDVTIAVKVFHGEQFGGLFYPPGTIELNAGLFTTDGGNMPDETGCILGLLHEWGHFAGLSHGDISSVMYYVMGQFPTDADRAQVSEFGRGV